MTFVLKYSIYTTILYFVIFNGDYFKVEARPKEVIPVPGWFNSVEGFVVPNLKAFQASPINENLVNRHIETDDLFNSQRRKWNKKRRKKIVKKVAKKFQEVDDNRRNNERGVVKKKKRHRSKGHRMKFIKSDLINNDINDSNVSESMEKQKKRKPFDIIVHIKMND
ncbi:uncharacterized protein LOC135083975 [Ostrinia nubilalis]|uniref:uncharacterized protein LOC135083975 n=1 Tax=Ostrinia nubilalis TaxID=29057 RepID=UPI00308255F1